jgi:hypothetical protein
MAQIVINPLSSDKKPTFVGFFISASVFLLEHLDILLPRRNWGLAQSKSKKTSWLVEVAHLNGAGKTRSDGASQPFVYKH